MKKARSFKNVEKIILTTINLAYFYDNRILYICLSDHIEVVTKHWIFKVCIE